MGTQAEAYNTRFFTALGVRQKWWQVSIWLASCKNHQGERGKARVGETRGLAARRMFWREGFRYVSIGGESGLIWDQVARMRQSEGTYCTATQETKRATLPTLTVSSLHLSPKQRPTGNDPSRPVEPTARGVEPLAQAIDAEPLDTLWSVLMKAAPKTVEVARCICTWPLTSLLVPNQVKTIHFISWTDVIMEISTMRSLNPSATIMRTHKAY